MPSLRSQNRLMFWRIVRRLLGANRGRLFVILLALGAGAAVTAALLNLEVDANRRIAAEFRAFGANTIVAPRGGEFVAPSDRTLSEGLLNRIPRNYEGAFVSANPFLYVVADVSTGALRPVKAVVVGSSAMGVVNSIAPKRKFNGGPMIWDGTNCVVGSAVSSRLRLSGTPLLRLTLGSKEINCRAIARLSTGSAEDNEVFANLKDVQTLAASPGRVSLIQLLVPGKPAAIDRYIAELKANIPDVDVRPIRQFTEGEAKIYGRISGLLTATVAVVLLLTGLCVMAAMTNVAMERKNDVGLMKAIGGATRRVLRLFLAEAALLGLAGGLIGSAAGILLSIWLGKQVFGEAAQPRLIVYPVAVALTMIVAILSAYPLRRLASIRPASVFRGEA
ncbi:MAG: ABC transporter permease [Candidatus Acidiferrales bacterium]